MPSRTAIGPIIWVLAASPEWEGDISWIPRPDRVIVADGGSTIASRVGLIPDLIVGDFDSSDPTLIEAWRKAGIEVRGYQHETKLETDTELAILAALEWKPRRIYMLGATGGRLDHTLANILLLTRPPVAEYDVRIIDGEREVYLAKPATWNSIEGHTGDTVSLLPVGADVTGVTLRGLLYPLDGETLPVGRGRGVSNEISGERAAVRFESGFLLVVVDHSRNV